ncbi:hemerythrin domain-containing protein [bacterium]|nr:hemerythrin domain-containing protein [bacterium]
MKTIKQYFEEDHDRLDNLFKNFQKLKSVDYPKAKEFFVQFKTGLQRHILWEEEILFPLFEKKSGMFHGGPTEVMRMEHRQIGLHLEAIHEKVKLMNSASDIDEQRLLDVLSVHNMKEENILYPAIDHAVTPEETELVFVQMRDVPEERYAQCCSH